MVSEKQKERKIRLNQKEIDVITKALTVYMAIAKGKEKDEVYTLFDRFTKLSSYSFGKKRLK